MAVSRKRKRPTPEEIERVSSEVAAKDPENKPLPKTKDTKKLGKSHKDNKDYSKLLVYIQTEAKEKLQRIAFEDKNRDMSDVANEIICNYLDIEIKA